MDVLKLCAKAGLVKVGRIALDGSKVKANASRHKAMSYDYMLKEEQRLKQEIKGLLAQAGADGSSGRPDLWPGAAGRGTARGVGPAGEPPAKDSGSESRFGSGGSGTGPSSRSRTATAGKPPSGNDPEQAKPEPKAQYNFTDPESKIMKVSNKGWDQCLNAEVVVNEHQIIVAADVTDETNDKKQVQPMIEQTQHNVAVAGVTEKVKEMVADSGFYSEANVEYLEGQKIDPFIATERLKHHEKISSSSPRPLPQGMTAKQRMARKLRTKRGRERYARRKGMVEPVFGQVKHGRGFRQFLLRGKKQMRSEWRLVSLTHNLLKLWRHGQSQGQRN